MTGNEYDALFEGGPFDGKRLRMSQQEIPVPDWVWVHLSVTPSDLLHDYERECFGRCHGCGHELHVYVYRGARHPDPSRPDERQYQNRRPEGRDPFEDL